MMFFRKIFPSKNDRFLKDLKRVVREVSALEETISSLQDDLLMLKVEEIKKRIKEGATRKKVLPEAFAVVREVAKRKLEMRHFDVQLMGGIVLVDGKVAEMATGEGKTLVATLAASLIAFEGKGVHVVTVNDFLAQRDADWMRVVYEALGLSVGVVTGETSQEDRAQAYQCDITYVTNNELGFDYLRDNMRGLGEEPVLRGLHFAIVDEVDSILVDEARTPLIISGPAEDKKELCEIADAVVRSLSAAHFEIDEKNKSTSLTEEGVLFVESLLLKQGALKEGESLYSGSGSSLLHFVTQSLKAHKLFFRNRDYIIRQKKLVLVDEFTGRIMEGRRFSDNLHQLLEVKEGLPIQRENQTLASVTYQNLFRKYTTLSGMSGTVLTESVEFFDIYKLECVGLPTNRPIQRKDKQDLLYATFEEKINAVVKKVEECHNRKQPVLIGTADVDKSEVFSRALKKAKIPHNVLNAKNHKKEALIIASAGEPGAVTIATNMAGRGTDIKLGGNFEFFASQVKNKADEAQYEKQKEEVLQAGGLCVIGTERHESRRIDNQLRGRSGRQGDPGETVFYLCLEDDLMRIFAGDRIQFLMKSMKKQKGDHIEHKVISRSVEKAQMRVEAQNYEVRKHLLKFDDVVNNQREMVYGLRREIIKNANDAGSLLREDIVKASQILVQESFQDGQITSEGVASLQEKVKRFLGVDDLESCEDLRNYETLLQKKIESLLPTWLDVKDQKQNYELAFFLLAIQDMKWRAHLAKVDALKQGVNLRSYAQRSPIVEFKKEAYDFFLKMLDDTVIDTMSFLVHNYKRTTGEPEKSLEAPASRNHPCPCGSGQKYKHCHGKMEKD